jgi:hypothetical protein
MWSAVEGLVVGVARVVELRALDRDRAEPAAVGCARRAHQEGDTVTGGFAEHRMAASLNT